MDKCLISLTSITIVITISKLFALDTFLIYFFYCVTVKTIYSRCLCVTQVPLSRAYGIRSPEPEPELDKLMNDLSQGKYDCHQYASSLLSACLTRWMMMYRALLRKGISIKNMVIIILFRYVMFLLYKTYFLLFVGCFKGVYGKPGN